MEKTKSQLLGEEFIDSMLDPNGSYTQYGLTKRQYFAGLAMQGWIACQHEGFQGDEFSIAARAVRCADVLLEELYKTK